MYENITGETHKRIIRPRPIAFS